MLEKTLAEFYKTGSGNSRGRCKDCIKAASRRRYASDPEHFREQAREWRNRNPNRLKTYGAKSRQRRIERNYRRVKRWRKDNPVQWKAQQERAAKREKRRGYPDAAKRRARSYDAFVEVVDRRTLYKLYEGLCGICGNEVDYSEVTVDHVIPLSRGGKHSYENCQLAHGPCNRRKGNKLLEEMDAF